MPIRTTPRRSYPFLIVTVLVVAGCGLKNSNKPDTSEPPAFEAPGADFIPVMLHHRKFEVDGSTWPVNHQDISNVRILGTAKNTSDSSYTTTVSFTSTRDGKGISAKVMVRYRYNGKWVEQNGKTIPQRSYPVDDVTPLELKKIGGW